MDYRRDLTQMAVAALILASTTSAEVRADETVLHGIFLAAGCPAHGCPSKNNEPVADNDKVDDKHHADDSHLNENKSPPKEKKGVNPAAGKPAEGQAASTYYKAPNLLAYNNAIMDRSYTGTPTNSYYYEGDNSVNHYNSQRSGITSPVYVEDYRSNTYYSRPLPTPEYGGLTNLNREYNTTTDYDYNRAQVNTSSSIATLTEAQLLGLLSAQGRAIYLSLDPEAKALAIQLASQDSYKDKNLAAREAQRRMNQRRGLLNR